MSDKTAPPLIAHVIFRLDIGGLENGLVNLINRLPRDRFRHAVLCLHGYSDFRERIEHPDTQVIDVGKQSGKDPAVYWRLYRWFRRLRPALVHTRNVGTIDAQAPAWLARVPHRVHGEHGWDIHDLRGDNRKYALLRRMCSPLIERFVSVSRDLANWLEAGVGIPANKIQQIYNGVDTTKFCVDGAPPADAPEGFFSPGNLVVGSVGRMATVKAQLDLVAGFLEVLATRPEAAGRLRLLMVGDGKLREQALEMLAAAGHAERAWLPGARADVPVLLRQMDMFVLPSLNEGISNTILEAMASGVPVIATEVGGNPELVDASCGRLVAVSQPKAIAGAIGDYLDNTSLLAAHSEQARQRAVERFSLDAMVTAYSKLYAGLVG